MHPAQLAVHFLANARISVRPLAGVVLACALLGCGASPDAGATVPTSSLPTYGRDSADMFDDTIERVNISLPRRVLQRLDALARSAGESRSGYIAQLTLEERPGSARAPETAETDR